MLCATLRRLKTSNDQTVVTTWQRVASDAYYHNAAPIQTNLETLRFLGRL